MQQHAENESNRLLLTCAELQQRVDRAERERKCVVHFRPPRPVLSAHVSRGFDCFAVACVRASSAAVVPPAWGQAASSVTPPS